MNPDSYPAVGMRKGMGRPKQNDPQRTVGFRLAMPIYVRLERVARARGESVSALVRNLVVLRLPKNEAGEN